MSDFSSFLSDPIRKYILQHSTRDDLVLGALKAETQKQERPDMQISLEQAQFMTLLVKSIGAKKTLDIGTFTGASALAVAKGIPDDGIVMSFELNPKMVEIAQTFWRSAGVSERIKPVIGPALDGLDLLLAKGDAETFDFSFIDADKPNYDGYYERSLRLVRRGGLIAIDNVLWAGRVADPSNQEENTLIIRELNQKIYQDTRVLPCMLPIGDGLTLALKV
jgi:predicted O-methyltransferase YrrM